MNVKKVFGQKICLRASILCLFLCTYTDGDIKMGLFQTGQQNVKNVEMELKKKFYFTNIDN